MLVTLANAFFQVWLKPLGQQRVPVQLFLIPSCRAWAAETFRCTCSRKLKGFCFCSTSGFPNCSYFRLQTVCLCCVCIRLCAYMPLATGVTVVVTKSPGHNTGLCRTGHRQNRVKGYFLSRSLSINCTNAFFIAGVWNLARVGPWKCFLG